MKLSKSSIEWVKNNIGEKYLDALIKEFRETDLYRKSVAANFSPQDLGSTFVFCCFGWLCSSTSELSKMREKDGFELPPKTPLEDYERKKLASKRKRK